MKTLYAIRRQVHISDAYGIQLSGCVTIAREASGFSPGLRARTPQAS